MVSLNDSFAEPAVEPRWLWQPTQENAMVAAITSTMIPRRKRAAAALLVNPSLDPIPLATGRRPRYWHSLHNLRLH
jgi:hypothetical protein